MTSGSGAASRRLALSPGVLDLAVDSAAPCPGGLMRWRWQDRRRAPA